MAKRSAPSRFSSWRACLAGLTALATLEATAGCARAHAKIAPSAPELRYVGRVDRTDPAGPRLAWPGTRLVARFTGTSIAIDARDLAKTPDVANQTWPNHVRIQLDDGPPEDVIVAHAGQGRLFERRGLAPGEHRLELIKESEALVGELQVVGVTLAPGASLLPPAPPAARRMELIGDSITAGYGNVGNGPKCPFSSDTERVTRSYGLLAAEALDAEVSVIAWSGRGITRNVNAPEGAELMPVLFQRTLPERADSAWSFEAWQPDVVVINLGANDFASGVPEAETFVSAYAAFAREVRARYPKAQLVLVIGPLVNDAWPPGEQRRTSMREMVQQVIERRRAAGDAHLDFLELPTPRPEEGLGCDYHPSAATHASVAKLLTERLRALLHW